MTKQHHKNSYKDKIVLRILAKGTFTLDTAAHLGSGEEGIANMMLLLDINGFPFIPGTTIAGAGKNYLAKRMFTLDKYNQKDEWLDELKLFGYNKNKHITQSPLYVSDAISEESTISIAIRDGVKLNRKLGIAEDKAKFDYEVVEAGAKFNMNFQLIIRENDPINDLRKQFYALLEGFEQGEIRLGKRTSRGLGRGRVNNWQLAHLDMGKETDVLKWLKNDINFEKKNGFYESNLRDVREFFKIIADFAITDSLMIRQNVVDDKMPDVDTMHICSKNIPLAPGGSLAGTLRTQVEFIANTLWNQKDSVTNVIDNMFGPMNNEGSSSRLWRSRVYVEEVFIENAILTPVERVAIDRFTGGSLAHAKFTEAPLKPKEKNKKIGLTISILLENPKDYEIGLLLLTLKDLWFKRCNIGGEASLGRGLLEGINTQLILRKYENNKVNIQKWIIKHGFNLKEGTQDILENFVKSAQKPPK